MSSCLYLNYFISRDKDDDLGRNLTVKPTAFMKLYSNGVDVTGGDVKLTDILTLTMELDAEYLGKFYQQLFVGYCHFFPFSMYKYHIVKAYRKFTP